MLQMVSFGIFLEDSGPKAAQMLQMASLVIFGPFRFQSRPDAPNCQFRYNFGHYFGANAAQMHQTISFGTSLNPFGPKAAQIVQMVISFVIILNHLLSDGFL